MVKNNDNCRKCKYDTYSLCSIFNCRTCPLHLEDAEETETHGYVYCRCLTVEQGNECPYYTPRINYQEDNKQ